MLTRIQPSHFHIPTTRPSLQTLTRATSSDTKTAQETKIAIGGYVSRQLSTPEIHQHFPSLMQHKNASGVEYRLGNNPTLPHMLTDSAHHWKILDPKPGEHITITHETPQGDTSIVLSKSNPSTRIPAGEFFGATASHPHIKIICCVEQFNEASLKIKEK